MRSRVSGRVRPLLTTSGTRVVAALPVRDALRPMCERQSVLRRKRETRAFMIEKHARSRGPWRDTRAQS